MRRSTITAAALALASLLPAVEARSHMPAEIRITEEEDEFAWLTGPTDRYYTQGLRVEWLSHPRERDARFLPGITHRDWCSLVCGADAAQRGMNAGYAFGQNIYTPADISIAAPQPNDRPYAGLLYVSRIARISYAEPRLAAQRQDRIEVSLGIVGPASLAKEAQTLVHELLEAGLPNGWANQLRNEPVLQLRYDIALRWPQKEGGIADIIPRVRVNLGNALTSLEADLTGRIGWNLSGFGVQAIPMAAAATAGETNALTGTRWLASGNFFLRGGMKAVVHNIFLDGNSFAHNDIRIHRTTFVPEYAAGVELNLVSNFWLTVQFIHRGSEFRTRSGREAPWQDFGSFTVAWIFGS